MSQEPTILRYEDIEGMVNSGKLITNWTKSSIQAASYDLCVGTIFKNGKIVNEHHEERDRPFSIQPGEIISIYTLEEVNLPTNIAGVAFPMNKWSSEGLLVLNPGHIDPGYQGPLTVTAINLRKTSINISRRQPIFTIIFHNIGSHTGHKYPEAALNRDEKERSFHARNQEIAPSSLGGLLNVMKDLPFVTRDQLSIAIQEHVNDPPFVTRDQLNVAIREHWTVKFYNTMVLAAAIFAILAVIVSLHN